VRGDSSGFTRDDGKAEGMPMVAAARRLGHWT
jgi:hypothetical protein